MKGLVVKMKDFKFSSTDIQVLKNFAAINQNVVLSKEGFYVRSNADTMVGIYKPNPQYEFERIGIYELTNFLSVINAYKNPTIEVHDQCLKIIESDSKVKYQLSPIEICHYFQIIRGATIDPFDKASQKYRVENNFEKIKVEMDFLFSAEKISMLMKMATILSANFVYFETIVPDKGSSYIKILVGNELENSDNTWELKITDGMTVNELPKIMKIKVSDLKLISDDFKVQISSNGIAKWEASTINLKYFIGAQTI